MTFRLFRRREPDAESINQLGKCRWERGAEWSEGDGVGESAGIDGDDPVACTGSEGLRQATVVDAETVRGHVDEVVRSTVEAALNQLLNEEADRIAGAGRYERSAERQDTRAGSYQRKLQTKAGEVELTVPRLSQLPLETAIIERHPKLISTLQIPPAQAPSLYAAFTAGCSAAYFNSSRSWSHALRHFVIFALSSGDLSLAVSDKSIQPNSITKFVPVPSGSKRRRTSYRQPLHVQPTW